MNSTTNQRRIIIIILSPEQIEILHNAIVSKFFFYFFFFIFPFPFFFPRIKEIVKGYKIRSTIDDRPLIVVSRIDIRSQGLGLNIVGIKVLIAGQCRCTFSECTYARHM